MKAAEFIKESLDTNVEFYHTGPDFDSFSHNFLGQGENQHLLGFGIYFINSKFIAEKYKEYVSDTPTLYTVKLNQLDGTFYNNRLAPTPAQESLYNLIAAEFGYKDFYDIPLKHSPMKFGRGLPGFVFSQLGITKGRDFLVRHKIYGQYEEVDSGLYEVAVYNLDCVKILSKSKI